jgi:predicted RNase H-like HicB family nuclease
VRLKIVYEPSDEGGYTAYVPALPGCISEEDTLEEARRHIREAIDVYLEPIEDEPLAGGESVVGKNHEVRSNQAAISSSVSSPGHRPTMAETPDLGPCGT